MKRSRFSDEQIIGILKEHAAGLTATELASLTSTAISLSRSRRERRCVTETATLSGSAAGIAQQVPRPGEKTTHAAAAIVHCPAVSPMLLCIKVPQRRTRSLPSVHPAPLGTLDRRGAAGRSGSCSGAAARRRMHRDSVALARVTVAEIVPEIIAWAHGPMHELTAGCLDDPRVTLVDNDVAMLIDTASGAYDAILLDVDNGPEGLTRLHNDHLYDRRGLDTAMAALRPRDILAVWSAYADPAFTTLLQNVGFEVELVTVHETDGAPDEKYVIWFAQKP